MPLDCTARVRLVIFLLCSVRLEAAGILLRQEFPVTEDFTCKGNKNLIVFKVEN